MIYLLTLFITALFAFTGHTAGAALIWCVAVAFIHAAEETTGELWEYFARLADAPWLTRVDGITGWLLIVAPAIAVQSVAAFGAFWGEEVNVFWLAVLIGARLGDALFSHAIPFSRDQKPNPGLPSAWVYALDGLLLAVIWHSDLAASPQATALGFAIGAGFFASVLPGLRFSARLFPVHD